MRTITWILLYLICFCGCEQTVSDPDWPDYSEKLVVRGEMTFTADDTVITECIVRRTLPLWEDYNQGKANVASARVQLEYNGQKYTIPPTSPYSARYVYAFAEFLPGTFTLSVSDSSKTAQAHIQVAELVSEFDTVFLHNTGSAYEVNAIIPVMPEKNESFVVRVRYRSETNQNWIYHTSWPYVPGRSYNYGYRKISPDKLLYHGFDIYHNQSEGLVVELTLYTYSKEYTAYELSRNSYYAGDEFFGSGDKNPDFTFTGDGIGFFWYKIEGPWARITVDG